MRKRNRLLVCLAAGVLILAVSATAAFGSVNGYTKYKEALKSLALETDNFTATGTMQVNYDGKEIASLQQDFAMEGQNVYSHSVSKDASGQMETYDTLLGIDTDDEMANRMVNFVEIAADTVVGELKNNFVQVGKENGVTQYQIEIAQNQVPSLVNAGLSLFAYSVDASNRENYTVNFADYSATVIHNYESTTGETLPEEFKDGYSNGYDDAWYETYGDLLDKVEEVNATNWEEKYYNVLEEQGGGIVYVSEDGSYDYYADYDAFAAAHPEAVGDSLESYVGQDLNLEKVLCTFSVDDQGRLTDNHIEVTFQTTEKDGSSHTLVLTGDVTLTNYGTTTVQPLDVGDRTLITY